MNDSTPTPATEELGYFYDTIHGAVSLDELPPRFRPTLKCALSSKTLERLRRISQLGHASVSYFSATHTRFSHAIGSMLVMNKLFRQVCRNLSPSVFDEVQLHFPDAVRAFDNPSSAVHCHLLLAALYQDTGELPFQKVSSLHFVPSDEAVLRLANDLPRAKPHLWNGKKVFSVLSLREDFRNKTLQSGFAGYDFEFAAYLMTGDGAPPASRAIAALLEMLDGMIDADRLDYVYRDAGATIGCLSSPTKVLESVISYEPNRVIVSDPWPAADFLSTRMRLWTYVYGSADVRFRQSLLKTLLDGRWDTERALRAFSDCELDPELPYAEFTKLDDNSLMERIEKLNPDSLKPYRREAQSLLLRGTLDYECRILKRRLQELEPAVVNARTELPANMFFDLLFDPGHHQLYRPGAVFVRQGLISKISPEMKLEDCAGAFSVLFSGANSAMLVPDGYYVFLPREHRRGGRWETVEKAIGSNTLFPLVAWEDARRGIPPTDTRNSPGFVGTSAISISYCSKDFPTVVRIVRELHRQKRRYRLFLRPFDGTGGSAADNSEELIGDAEAVLAVVSSEYLLRATDSVSPIATEVRAMHRRAESIPVIPAGVDERPDLDGAPEWDWGEMNEAWRGKSPVMPYGLRNCSDEVLRAATKAICDAVDGRKRP